MLINFVLSILALAPMLIGFPMEIKRMYSKAGNLTPPRGTGVQWFAGRKSTAFQEASVHPGTSPRPMIALPPANERQVAAKWQVCVSPGPCGAFCVHDAQTGPFMRCTGQKG